jgi:predicted nicotinamide N-methyase
MSTPAAHVCTVLSSVVLPQPVPPTFPYAYDLRSGQGTLTIHQDPQAHWGAGIGASVWDCALTTAKFVEHNATRFRGKRVVELGAGTGLVGLVAAACGADVMFTDQAFALPLVQYNVVSNQAVLCQVAGRDIRLVIQGLNWGDASAVLADVWFTRPDVIIASDCVVWMELITPLFQTIKWLATETRSAEEACVEPPPLDNTDVGTCQVYLCYEHRNAEVTAVLMSVISQFGGFQKVPRQLLDPDFVCDEICLYEWFS